MEKSKLPLEYGPREAAILRALTESHKLPSKNEGFRRGIVAVDYLMDVDKRLLFEVLADLLDDARDSLKKSPSAFAAKVEASKSLASEIVATFAVQDGIESAESIDIFRADLENYSVQARTRGFKGVENVIAERLSSLSTVAREFSRKRFDNRMPSGDFEKIVAKR